MAFYSCIFCYNVVGGMGKRWVLISESCSFYPSPLGDDAEVSDAGQTPTGGRWGGTLSYSGWDNGLNSVVVRICR